jgi:flagellar hook protein FlgE
LNLPLKDGEEVLLEVRALDSDRPVLVLTGRQEVDSYSNGQKQNVGQLALADVANVQGLEMLGNGDFATTLASGTASIGVSGSAGLGVLQGGTLEGSNVNISQEFSNLIIAQRAFEANSKTVTTFDSVTQETISMIH